MLSWFKASFQDGWNGYVANPHVELTIIPKARALMLDDQPAHTDAAIAAFAERAVGPTERRN